MVGPTYKSFSAFRISSFLVLLCLLVILEGCKSDDASAPVGFMQRQQINRWLKEASRIDEELTPTLYILQMRETLGIKDNSQFVRSFSDLSKQWRENPGSLAAALRLLGWIDDVRTVLSWCESHYEDGNGLTIPDIHLSEQECGALYTRVQSLYYGLRIHLAVAADLADRTDEFRRRMDELVEY